MNNNDTRATGYITDICDGIISVCGLSQSFCGELVTFNWTGSAVYGFVWNLEDNICKVPLLSGHQETLCVGDSVYSTNKLVSTRCGFGVLGEIMNPLGEYLICSSFAYKEFTLANLFNTTWTPVEARAPGIIARAPVKVPFMTGVASIDSFIPIGCGQRELIIGDQNAGKTSLAITAIINQRYRNNVICGIWNEAEWSTFKYSLFFPCVYVSIGSKRSEIVRLRKVLQGKEALHYTSIVFTSADDMAALQYLAPFAGCAIGEWFMKHGYNAVVVYDDLTKHAIAYRQMALLLRRPPGREAYPGDIFHLHSRLLERSAQLSTGGSLTALPIVQTLGGDSSGYISTNVISITDGQIFLVKSLINKGVRPAVDLTLSVSRVGSAAQYPAMSFVSKRIKSMYSLYRMYAGIVKLGGEDAEAILHVRRGERLLSFFTQEIYETYSLYKQVVGLYALTLESMDHVLPNKVHLFFTLLGLSQFNYLYDMGEEVSDSGYDADDENSDDDDDDDEDDDDEDDDDTDDDDNKSNDEHLVTYFPNPRLIEPLLMVFSFNLIRTDITLLVNKFSAFFIDNIQEQTIPEAIYLITELFKHNDFREEKIQ